MKIYILISVIVLSIISCNRKTEFVQSKAVGDLFLLKNPPKEDSLVKSLIKYFLLKNLLSKTKKQLPQIDFYRYTSDTKYFLNHKEDGSSGLSLGEEQLSFYINDKIACFIVSKCKDDTTKLVGRFHFYGNKGNKSELDTIIYKCN
ncbi:hypothetical protein GON26_19850 [Flavobacterium sp. GA093]|uniref:Lipoprotein n=1 Tax=Flavobacterium hydrocarbonoxydans TaxID=2683249 RepID=A0A6I4NQY7_9FLAO|nr:hypothetical protein [Flavobacterium hydrocarbonoxydans]MWB96623.1 hypothetical protein [Flavobacterium hydrocarbonoxydans]